MEPLKLFEVQGQTVFPELAADHITVLRYVSYPADAYDSETCLFDTKRAIEVDKPTT